MSFANIDTFNNDHVCLWHGFYDFAGLALVLAGQYFYCVIFLYVHGSEIKQLREREK